MQEHKATPEMKMFFTKLLELKKFVKDSIETTSDQALIKNIYEKLDGIIKEGE